MIVIVTRKYCLDINFHLFFGWEYPTIIYNPCAYRNLMSLKQVKIEKPSNFKTTKINDSTVTSRTVTALLTEEIWILEGHWCKKCILYT